MTHYIDRSTMCIGITNGELPSRAHAIDDHVIAVIGDLLQEGRPLNRRQAEFLGEGDTAGFLKSLDLDELERFGNGDLRPRVRLPNITRYEYTVVPVSEAGGLGTAKGTVNRMKGVLNEMGNAGWELATTSERDSRWMGGETILLTFRRGVVTEDDFRDRARAEERIRRRVVAELDAEDAT